jgi:type VI secretion system (T6SS) phospholipase Tle1-like effector
MPKNILIFSDGTGMAGGITFDEDRTNIYKLYRSTRCGPDSCIDPNQQIAFYDPGLGSPADGGFIWGKTGRWLYNLVSQATGLGITANIIDCYAALIRLYRTDDQIFLFGFSRGAYTVRCVAAVIAQCGIPRRLPNGEPVPLDVAGARAVATQAVKNVYQFCSSSPRKREGSYRDFMLDTRALIATKFRNEHNSSNPADPNKANVYPYFIGVCDTVAALGRPAAAILFMVGFAILLALLSGLISLFSGLSTVAHIGWLLSYLKFKPVFGILISAYGLALVTAYLWNYLKFDFSVPGYGFWKSLATIHFAPPQHKFTDYTLNVNVTYAKHAISIDEDRKDFKRVQWIPDATKATTRDAAQNLYFEQVWFAGVHADIGGGYPENESRLSDVTLQWMLAAASIVPNGIKFDASVLRPCPDSAGPQHDECKAGHWEKSVRDLPLAPGTTVSRAIMHKSVYTRFEAAEVLLYDHLGRYRPPNLKNHVDFGHYYDDGRQPARLQCVADDIERKWSESNARTN